MLFVNCVLPYDIFYNKTPDHMIWGFVIERLFHADMLQKFVSLPPQTVG